MLILAYSLTLFNLATEFSWRCEIFKAGATEPLVAQLGAVEPEVVRASLKALVLLCDEYNTREAFSQAGGMA